MQVEILSDAEAVAVQAAKFVAAEARAAATARGRFTLAVSGGTTPWQMLRALANEEVPWPALQIFQVDERVAPPGDADRNLTHLRESLLSHAPLKSEQIHAMPVEAADLEQGALDYSVMLAHYCGTPAVLDLVHLGLGPDGHTASLVPGDPVLKVFDRNVATTGPYQNRRRMTLTYPILNRARRILWLATGSSKQEMLAKLLASDPTIPAGSVNGQQAIVLADKAAMPGGAE